MEGFGEKEIHALAVGISVIGPLVNYFLKPMYSPYLPGPYAYWAIMLSFYICALMLFIRKDYPWTAMTMARLVIFGVTVEDFFSNVWYTLLSGRLFLPFSNWYTQYFPFFEVLGNPTPVILIPMWYVVAAAIYIALSLAQWKIPLLRPRQTTRTQKSM
jgi:hypothetical protein